MNSDEPRSSLVCVAMETDTCTSIYQLEKLKPFFRLHPPKGGFERKGIKKPFMKIHIIKFLIL